MGKAPVITEQTIAEGTGRRLAYIQHELEEARRFMLDATGGESGRSFTPAERVAFKALLDASRALVIDTAIY